MGPAATRTGEGVVLSWLVFMGQVFLSLSIELVVMTVDMRLLGVQVWSLCV